MVTDYTVFPPITESYAALMSVQNLHNNRTLGSWQFLYEARFMIDWFSNYRGTKVKKNCNYKCHIGNILVKFLIPDIKLISKINNYYVIRNERN